MSLRYVVRMLMLAGLMPVGAMALGLGEIHLKSTLNAPLDADIDLTVSAEELSGLKVALASRESFARYGLDYPAYLSSVTLQPAKSADGRDVIHVHSTEVVTEPFATLLIEAAWARGRLVHEYTVLLDPPVFTGTTQGAAVEAPSAASESQAGSVARQADSSAVAAAAATPAPSAAGATSAPTRAPAPVPSASASQAGGTYLVRRGDTLSNIAARHYTNAEREQALVALYRGNTSAFEGNMNVLRTGATLQLPDESALSAVGPAAAASEVASQYRAWAPARTAGQLHLVAPSPSSAQSSAKGGTAQAGADTGALQQQVTQLQAELAESKRLLELRNAELARMQERLGKGGAAASAPAASAAAPAVTQTPVPAPAAAPSEPAATAPIPETSQATPQAAKKPASAPAAPKAGENGGGSFLDWLIENWLVALGALAILAAGAFGWRFLRARQSQDMDRSLDRLSTPPFEAPARTQRTATTQPIRALAAQDDSAIVVEESGTHEAPRLSGRDPGAVKAAPVAVDDTVSGDTAVALDQGDPLAEADFHMAYGLYDQAADLVRIAIAREPQRRDLKLKLLEVFFVWGNKEQFLQLARELSTTRDQSLSGEWEKIVIMGRQIAPDDALFSSAGALPGAASGGVDLNLEGGQNRVDFDLLGEPTIAPDRHAEGVDLDLGAALGDADSTGQLRAIGDTGVDFMLDDPARGSEATGSTREMPQSHTVTLEAAAPTQEVPTVEQPQFPGTDSPTIRQKLDVGVRQSLAANDQTAELAIDDLGLDLAGSDLASHAATSAGAGDSSPTMLGSLDEDTRSLLARAHADLEQTGTEAAPSESGAATTEQPVAHGDASGTWLFTDKDISALLPSMDANAAKQAATHAPTEVVTALMPSVVDTHTGLTNQIAALRSAGAKVDLNLDNLEVTGTPAGQGLDLDVGTSEPPSDAHFVETQRLAKDVGAADPEPATMSEVGTKLDLARAYMDMGDPEGARSILDEVLAEGSASQKTEARRLIDSLPG